MGVRELFDANLSRINTRSIVVHRKWHRAIIIHPTRSDHTYATPQYSADSLLFLLFVLFFCRGFRSPATNERCSRNVCCEITRSTSRCAQFVRCDSTTDDGTSCRNRHEQRHTHTTQADERRDLIMAIICLLFVANF